MMKIEKLEAIPSKNPNIPVKVTEMGNIIEVQYMNRRNNKQTILMLPGGDRYCDLSTGEIKECIKHETRADQKNSLYRTFNTARGLINSNVTDVSKVRWCTLTYAENMTDPKQLYQDFKKFNMRFQYYCKSKGYSNPEYIVMMEPQGRGAWHAHLLYIWEDMKAPFISNQEFREIWGHGFVKIKKLDDVDNIGAYLTAYLGDMDVEELPLEDIIGYKVKEVEIEENGVRKSKFYVKGARLKLYPAKFNMIRCSRGVKRPTVEMLLQNEAEKKVLGATKTFESAIKLTDSENDFKSIIIKEYYNKTR